MQILMINNFGGGYADYMQVPAAMTVEELFTRQLPGCEPQDYLIRVNRQPVPRDYVLQEGDRVSITPVKVEGAVAA